MVSPGGLVEIIAALLGIEPRTVAQFDRQLAENGLRTSGGRGRSAAQVTSVDAANLLIAILGAPPAAPAIKQAVETWKTYAELPALNSRGHPRTFPAESLFLSSMAELPPGHSFRDGLAALIDSIRFGEYRSLCEIGKKQAFLDVTIAWRYRRPTAGISVNGFHGETERVVYEEKERPPGSKRKVKKGGQIGFFDMTQSRSISRHTLVPLAELLGPLRPPWHRK